MIVVAVSGTGLMVWLWRGMLLVVIIFEAAIVIVSVCLVSLPIVPLTQHPTTTLVSAAAPLHLRGPQRIRRVHTMASNLIPVIIELRPMLVTRLVPSSTLFASCSGTVRISDVP